MPSAGKPANLDEMISELRKMLTPRIRTGAEVERRTQVFAQIALMLEEHKRIMDALEKGDHANVERI